MMPLPLSGIRVLTIEHYGAGPYASQHLAEMGAEVIKIEAPKGGDSARQAWPHFLGPDESHFFQAFNLNKKSLALDLRQPEARSIFEALAATADVVMNNLRGDQPDKLKIAYEHLCGINPKMVCAHLSGYGRSGSRADRPAYDFLMQAEAGFMALTGEPGSDVTRMGLSIIDFLTGIHTAFAVAASLVGALKTGRGRDIEISLFDVALHQLTYPATWYLNEGHAIERRPRSGHPMIVPCEMFPTADGRLFIMAVLPKFWEDLCLILGHPDWPQDARFATPLARFENRDALADAMDAVLKTRTTAEWIEAFAGRVPAAPILSLKQALDNPYLAERGNIQRIDHPLRKGWAALTSPIRPDGQPVTARPAPMLGEQTDEILGSIGIGADRRAALRAKGVIR
jgi:succinate---hydroxymethylglutarate CoA-transferase